MTLSFSYDALGRLENERSSDEALNISYSYDIKDRIVSAKNHLTNKTTHRHYDPQGDPISETLENGLTSCYSYDALNRLIEITLPDSGVLPI